MDVDELFLYGAVESFAHGIHFWAFGVGVEMGDGTVFEQLVEVAFEFAAAIGYYLFDRERGELEASLKEVGGV